MSTTETEPTDVFWKPPPKRAPLPIRIALAVGATIMVLGLLVLGFVGYVLWGTGVGQARAQDNLRTSFAAQLATTTTSAPAAPATTLPPADSTGSPATTVVDTTAATATTEAVFPADGTAVAHLAIPTIDVDQIIVEGVTVAQLRRAPGHITDTPSAGQIGNAVYAGHRTTYGAPFSRIDELQPGDKLTFTTPTGMYTYTVTGSRIVEPTDATVVAQTLAPTVTLISCWPRYSTKQRIIVTATLDPAVSSPAQPAIVRPTATAVTNSPTATTAGSSATSQTGPTVVDVTTAAINEALNDPFTAQPWTNTGAWALGLAAVAGMIAFALLARYQWRRSRRRRMWRAATILNVVPALGCLWVVYAQAVQLLPLGI